MSQTIKFCERIMQKIHPNLSSRINQSIDECLDAPTKNEIVNFVEDKIDPLVEKYLNDENIEEITDKTIKGLYVIGTIYSTYQVSKRLIQSNTGKKLLQLANNVRKNYTR